MSSSTTRRPSFADSTYYPPGWTRDRLINAPSSDLKTLPNDEFDRMRMGMIEKMGQARFGEFLKGMAEREGVRDPTRATTDAPTSRDTPDFIKTAQERYRDQEWGFIVYRSCNYGDASAWKRFRDRFDGIVAKQFDRFGDAPGVEEARQRFSLVWEDGTPELEGKAVEEIASIYGRDYPKPDTPFGLHHPFFLLVTPEAMDSVLNSTSQTPSTPRASAPFVEIVSSITTDEEYEEECRQRADEEEEPYPLHFKVAVETLLTDFFDVVGTQMMDLNEMGGHLRDRDIWFSVLSQYIER